jgi:hypothetical protein
MVFIHLLEYILIEIGHHLYLIRIKVKLDPFQ